MVKRNQLGAACYVGDTMKDYVAAKRAKVAFVHAAYGFGEVEEAVIHINKIEEISKVVELIFQ
ncbi:hypothetical protein lbkm_1938 [Lachnospiraceae bacterium KM106-2]|nr:hypothetical protein lbkm_1938 [Lachnospiraceae bacterium KM106-2]